MTTYARDLSRPVWGVAFRVLVLVGVLTAFQGVLSFLLFGELAQLWSSFLATLGSPFLFLKQVLELLWCWIVFLVVCAVPPFIGILSQGMDSRSPQYRFSAQRSRGNSLRDALPWALSVAWCLVFIGLCTALSPQILRNKFGSDSWAVRGSVALVRELEVYSAQLRRSLREKTHYRFESAHLFFLLPSHYLGGSKDRPGIQLRGFHRRNVVLNTFDVADTFQSLLVRPEGRRNTQFYHRGRFVSPEDLPRLSAFRKQDQGEESSNSKFAVTFLESVLLSQPAVLGLLSLFERIPLVRNFVLDPLRFVEDDWGILKRTEVALSRLSSDFSGAIVVPLQETLHEGDRLNGETADAPSFESTGLQFSTTVERLRELVESFDFAGIVLLPLGNDGSGGQFSKILYDHIDGAPGGQDGLTAFDMRAQRFLQWTPESPCQSIILPYGYFDSGQHWRLFSSVQSSVDDSSLELEKWLRRQILQPSVWCLSLVEGSDKSLVAFSFSEELGELASPPVVKTPQSRTLLRRDSRVFEGLGGWKPEGRNRRQTRQARQRRQLSQQPGDVFTRVPLQVSHLRLGENDEWRGLERDSSQEPADVARVLGESVVKSLPEVVEGLRVWAQMRGEGGPDDNK